MQSIWSESCKFRKREVLDKDIKTDTIIIGAGMAGILIGYMLKQNGIDVILIDAAEMASGNTKNTTAKITSQHDLIYDKLISEFGEKKARQYAKANELAIKKYKEIIKERKIDCEFDHGVTHMHRRRFYIFIQLRFRMLYSLIFLLHGHVLSPSSVKSISSSPNATISTSFSILQILHNFIIPFFI